LLFAAGGMTGQGHVHNAITAERSQRTVSGTRDQSLISEVMITQDGAWFTDSLQAKLYLVPISPTGLTGGFSVLALTGPAAITSGVEPKRYGGHTRRTHPDRRTFDQPAALYRRSGDRGKRIPRERVWP
jgi:hypothetical protein